MASCIHQTMLCQSGRRDQRATVLRQAQDERMRTGRPRSGVGQIQILKSGHSPFMISTRKSMMVSPLSILAWILCARFMGWQPRY